MPRYAAERVLLAPVEDVWRFLAEPYHLSDWFPGITGVQPDHRGFAEGARWHIQGPGYLRRAEAPKLLVIKEIRPLERFAFELVRERLAVEVELRAADAGRTRVAVAVSGRFLLGPRSRMAKSAVDRLYDLVQTAADL